MRIAIAIALLACAAGLSATAQQTPPPIVLGMSAAFTGPSGQLGTELYRGAFAYLRDVEGKGGVNGRALRILAYDDGYDPVRAIRNTIKLVEVDRVSLLFGYVGTPTVTRVLPLIKRYGDRAPYLFFPFTGAQPQRTPPYNEIAFNLRASYEQETAGLVDNFTAIGRRRIAIFYQADAYGRSGWDGVRKALARQGLQLAGEATYRRGAPYTTDMTAQVQALRASNADAIVSVGSYAACAAFIRDTVNAGWELPIANVSFVGSESMLALLLETAKQTGRDYTSRLINSQVVPSYEDESLPAVREYLGLLQRYQPMPPPELVADPRPVHPSFAGFEGFLNAKLLVEILKRSADPSNKVAFRRDVERLTSLDIGIDVPVSFGADRHQGLDRVYYTVVRGTEFHPLQDWRAFAQ